MADVTYYVAMPFLQDDSGALVAGAAEECQSPTTALPVGAMPRLAASQADSSWVRKVSHL